MMNCTEIIRNRSKLPKMCTYWERVNKCAREKGSIGEEGEYKQQVNLSWKIKSTRKDERESIRSK
jgi:hypothetical protein